MAHFLLILHVATAIVFIGGVTVSASVFPRYATAEAAAGHERTGAHPTAIAMHRITRGYGKLAIITPAAGLVLALVTGRVSELWILLSIVLVAVGGALLVWRIIPMQKQMLASPPEDPKARGRAVASAGLLNIVWLVILILMVSKPGGDVFNAMGSVAGSTASAPASQIAVVDSEQRGEILVDDDGYVLYMFVPDNRGTATCTLACAKDWPVLVAPSGEVPASADGIDTGLIGSVTDASGRNVVTYNGWPLYRREADKQPGQHDGQSTYSNGGMWHAMRPDGAPITTTP